MESQFSAPHLFRRRVTLMVANAEGTGSTTPKNRRRRRLEFAAELVGWDSRLTPATQDYDPDSGNDLVSPTPT
jgi:hypothetical protein